MEFSVSAQTSPEKPTPGEALAFIKRVQEIFRRENQEDRYYSFASALEDFRKRIICQESVVEVAERVFDGHEDLLQEFKIFLSEGQEFVVPPETNAFESKIRGIIEFLNKVRQRFGDNLEVYRFFLEGLCKHYNEDDQRKMEIYVKVLSKGEVYDDDDHKMMIYLKVLGLFHGHADLVHQFEGLLSDGNRKVRKKIERVRLVVMEDQMHELDVLQSNLESAIDCGEEALKEEATKGIPIRVDEKFTKLNLKCIERLYGDEGVAVVEELKANPKAVLPVVLERLKKKKEELIPYQYSTRKFWREIIHELNPHMASQQEDHSAKSTITDLSSITPSPS